MKTNFACFFSFLVILLMQSVAIAQVQDNFEDASFATNGIWQGDTQFFELNNGKLRSVSTIANHTFFVSTNAKYSDTTIWMLSVQLAFNPSGSNYVDWFLSADTATFTQVNAAFFVRIGNTLDEVSLFQMFPGKAAQKIIDGRDKILDKSSNNLVVKVQYINGKWDLWVNEQGQLEPLFHEGSFVDTGFVEFPYTGLLIRQSTASFFGKHSFDFFYMGPPIRDSVAPVLLNSGVEGRDSIWFVFSKPLDTQFLVMDKHFEISPSHSIKSFSFSNTSDSLFIKLNTSLFSFTNYTFYINNLKDRAGNSLDTVWHLNFVYPEQPKRYDIVINELMVTPLPSIGLPSSQYIEIKNVSKKAISLDSFMFSDRSTTSFLRSYLLMPDSILIICPNNAVSSLSGFGKVMGVSNFPSLNKTQDDVYLRSKSGSLIHHIAYTLSWYNDEIKAQGGFSLEMIDANNPCVTAQNWTASSDVLGGTPGAENSVKRINPDTIAPQLLSIYPVARNQIELVFNETLDSLSVVFLQNWKLNDTGNKLLAAEFIYPSSVKLIFKDDFKFQKYYTVTISGVSDCAGNTLFVRSPLFGLPEEVAQLDVVINEIMVNPTPSQYLPPFQYVELKNRSKKLIDLSAIDFSTRNTKISLPPYLLFPDSIVVIATQQAQDLQNWTANLLLVSSLPTMNKSADELSLLSKSGELIFEVAYSDNWYKDVVKKQGGFSLEMISDNVPCSKGANWLASMSMSGGTPGSENSVVSFLIDSVSPYLLSVYPVSEFELRLKFNEIILQESVFNEAVFFVPELGVYISEILQISAYEIFIELPFEMQRNELYTLEISGIKDCVGNEMLPVKKVFGLPNFPKKGDVLVNEILFNPPVGAKEFVEIYNQSNHILDLKHLRIGNLREDGSIRDALDLFSEGYLFLPKSYICMGVDVELLCAFYDCKNKEALLPVARLPSYPQRNGGVVILSSSGAVLDSFLYDDDMHFALIKDKKGVSLERIAFNRNSADRTNWVSATANAGFATPGYVNSQSENIPKGEGNFWMPRSVFSPNGDGFEDRISIGYNMPKSGFVVNVYVFSSQGAYVGNPIGNQTIGIDGALVWDGFIENNGVPCSPGIYILLVEAFNLDGSVLKAKFAVSLTGY